MSLNCNEINKIIDELNIQNCLIQDIVQPGFDTLALYTYGVEGAKTVLICTCNKAVRLNETRRKVSKNDKPLRFMEFLKSRIKGSRIEEFYQIGKERVVLMKLRHGEEKFNLYIKLWSGASNIILTDDQNTVLDAMYRRPHKGEVCGEVYTPPVPQESDKEWPVRDFKEVRDSYKRENPQYPDLSFNQCVDIWYSEYADTLSRDALLAQAEKWYSSTKNRMEAAYNKLLQKQKSFENAEALKHQGDLVLSYGYLIDGSSKFLECEDYETGKTVRLLIDPSLSAHENAKVYYDNYKKALSGSESIKHDIELTKKQILKLESLYEEILKEPNPLKIEQLLRKDSKPKQQKKKKHPGLDYTVDGWYILVGRDANENDELLRHHVNGSDMWLHVRDYSGGYVFIKNRKDKTIPLDILLDAANLAVYYSKARNTNKVDLYYTYVKYLRRAKNGPKGLVLPTHEKNICVEPDKKRLEKLDEIRQEMDW